MEEVAIYIPNDTFQDSSTETYHGRGAKEERGELKRVRSVLFNLMANYFNQIALKNPNCRILASCLASCHLKRNLMFAKGRHGRSEESLLEPRARKGIDIWVRFPSTGVVGCLGETGGSHGQLFLLGMGPGAQLIKEPHCFPGPESGGGDTGSPGFWKRASEIRDAHSLKVCASESEGLGVESCFPSCSPDSLGPIASKPQFLIGKWGQYSPPHRGGESRVYVQIPHKESRTGPGTREHSGNGSWR